MPSKFLFQRSWCLSIGPRIAPPTPTHKELQFTSAPKVGVPLRFTFQVEQTIHSHSNKATITLYNLAQKTIDSIDRGSTISLSCTYGTQLPTARDVIFLGRVVERVTRMEGSDYATELTCGDSEFPLQQGRVQVSFARKTTVGEILKAIAKQLSVDIGGEKLSDQDIKIESKLIDRTVGRYVAAGPAKRVLDDLLVTRGIDWYFQNRKLIVQDKFYSRKIQAIGISAASGLLEAPVAGQKGVQLRALILPTLSPGTPILISSDSAHDCNGFFRVVQAVYHGDTHGQDWNVDIYADKLKKPLDPGSVPKDAKATDNPATDDATMDEDESDEDDVDA